MSLYSCEFQKRWNLFSKKLTFNFIFWNTFTFGLTCVNLSVCIVVNSKNGGHIFSTDLTNGNPISLWRIAFSRGLRWLLLQHRSLNDFPSHKYWLTSSGIGSLLKQTLVKPSVYDYPWMSIKIFISQVSYCFRFRCWSQI